MIPRFVRHPLAPRKRVSYPKSVTIGLGVLTQDGVVLASDTLESWGFGYKKTQTPKILTGSTSGKTGLGCVAVSGAGDGHYLDGIKQDVVDLFLSSGRTQPGHRNFESDLKKLVRKFHVDHIIPFAKYPSEERPSVSLLVGAYNDHLASMRRPAHVKYFFGRANRKSRLPTNGRHI